MILPWKLGSDTFKWHFQDIVLTETDTDSRAPSPLPLKTEKKTF